VKATNFHFQNLSAIRATKAQECQNGFFLVVKLLHH